LFLDLNNFKAINDSFGHEQGDALLVGISKKLRGCMRSADTAARLGGDEFTVLLEDIDGLDEVIGVAERIATELANPIAMDGADVAVSASIGISIGGPQVSAGRLLHEADVAMYHSKRNGRVYQMFESELELA
jgi:diguanylate cyclase (GGDEF)-like protein